MDDSRKRVIKARGVMLATAGLGVALLVMLGMRSLHLTSLSYQEWLFALLLTSGIQGLLLAMALRGWDRWIPGDGHFLFTPLIGAFLILMLYVFLAPELRFMVLLGWFVALLFMAGLGGFHAVVALTGVMTLGYFAMTVVHYRQGYPLSLTFEAAMAGSVFVIGMYAGAVFERLRSDRHEMKQLRLKLAEMALTDALTELPNRRHFEGVLRAELDRVRRYGGHCTVAMVDVDYFKHYNDTVGHMAGDIVLRELADVMRREFRLHDMVSRYGGEEFALIMINASKQEARPIMERLRIDVEEHPFRHRDVQPTGRLTISAGLASFPEDGTTYEDLLQRADDALYRAKDAGRNRVCLAGPAEPAGRSA